MLLRPLASALFSAALAVTVAAATPNQKPDVKSRIVATITRCHDALVKGDTKGFVSDYADDVLIVDEGGYFNKKQMTGMLKGFQLTSYKLEDVRLVALTNKSWVLSYRITQHGVYGGTKFVNKAIISTAWTEKNHQFLCHLVQETTVK